MIFIECLFYCFFILNVYKMAFARVNIFQSIWVKSSSSTSDHKLKQETKKSIRRVDYKKNGKYGFGHRNNTNPLFFSNDILCADWIDFKWTFKFYLYITNDVNICSFYSSFTGVFFFGNAFHSKKSTNYRCFSGSNFISMFYLNWHRNIVQSETTKPVREKNFNFLNVYFGVMFGFALTFICFIECIALNHTNNS